ncbi:DUF4834 family protein [Pedobacter sp. SYSU D00535]|uniref:DUF4834 family protein n=1 Tax=Pedobacter sp. SYSU D00535 TaxID=2810308 RepID=UPI001F6108EB|nr:DUF4834 family protein [Pedobacter sp. SYSU D00535]
MILKILFITILVLYLLKLIARIVLPMLFQKMVNKAQQQVNQQFRQQGAPYNQQQYRQQKPTGQLHVDYVPPKDKEARAADKAGDFIDFEEIK